MVDKDKSDSGSQRGDYPLGTHSNGQEEDLHLRAAILQSVLDGIFLIGLDDGIIKYTNHRFAGMFGYGEGELLGENVAILNAPVGKKSPENVRDEILNV